MVLSFPRRSGSFSWLASLADPLHIRATINKLSIMNEIHDAIVACRSSNNKRLRNPRLLVAIKVRNKTLFVRNNPQAKELCFLQNPAMVGVPTDEGIQQLKWFIQQVKDDLAQPVSQAPVAPLPLAGPSAQSHEPLEHVDSGDEDDKESDDGGVEPEPKRQRFLNLPSDHPLVVAGLKEFSSHKRCERALWYSSRRSFKVIRKDKMEVLIRVRALKSVDVAESRISKAVTEGVEFLDELDGAEGDELLDELDESEGGEPPGEILCELDD